LIASLVHASAQTEAKPSQKKREETFDTAGTSSKFLAAWHRRQPPVER
jgi:hypothetical protein